MKQTYEQAVAGGHVGRARKRLTKILQEQQQLALMEGVPPEPQPEAQAAGGEGPDHVLLTIQGVPTTSGTSATQAQVPPPIVVVNIVGIVTKGE